MFVIGFILAAGGAAFAYFTIQAILPDTGATVDAATTSAPTDLVVQEISATQIAFSWKYPASQVPGTRYRVSVTGVPAACPPTTGTTCIITDLTPGGRYSLSVIGFVGAHWQSPPATLSFTALGVTTTSLATAIFGKTYLGKLQAVGGTRSAGSAYTWSSVGSPLPVGLALTSTNGVISGTPTAVGTAEGLRFKATDAKGFTATSGTLSISVAKERTEVAVTSSVNPSMTGQPIAFTATVSPQYSGNPTGAVTFTIADEQGGAESCTGSNTVTLSNHKATCTLPLVAVGSSYVVAVHYDATTDYSASTGALAGGQRVETAHTSTRLTSTSGADSASTNPGASVTGQPVTYKATVVATAPGSGIPGGAVTFNATPSGGNAVIMCPKVHVLAGSASCQISGNFLAATSPYVVTATYAGSPTFASSAASVTEVVSKATPQFTFKVTGGSTALVTYGTRASLAAAGLPSTGTGKLRFEWGTTKLCTVTLPADTCSTPAALTAGSYTLTVHYGGTGNYTSATSSNVVALTVDPLPTSFTASVSPSSIRYGQSAKLRVSGLTSGANGTVVFTTDSGGFLCQVTVPATRDCTTPVDITAGSYADIKASYGGAKDYAPSVATVPAPLTVYQVPTEFGIAVNGGTLARVPTGTAVTLSESGLPTARASGTVTFRSGSVTLCAATLPSTGCSTTPALPPGTYSGVIGLYGGTTNYASSNSTNGVTLVVAVPPPPPPPSPAPVAGLELVTTSPVTLSGGCDSSISNHMLCTDQGLAARSYTMKLALVSATGSETVNATGALLTVTASPTTGSTPAGTTTPSSATIAPGQSVTSTSFTVTGTGTPWSAKITFKVTVAGQTFALTLTAS